MGFSEPTPNKVGVRPVTSSSRKTRALWNIFSHEKLKTHVVGWWPSNPVEPINGIMISNLYHKAQENIKKWGMPPQTVHPQKYKNLFKFLRIHPSELTEEHLIPFVPNAKDIDQDKDKRLYQVSKLLAEAGTVQAATTWILDNEEWDFTGVYLDTVDHFCHGFMNYHPPKMSVVSDEDYELYKDVVNSNYRFHDMMLEELIKLAGDDATIMLISDHGFHSDHLRPKLLPDEPAAPALQHRDYGVFCVKGPGIKKNNKIFGASLIDITPTILSLYDLPIGEDMNGKVLVNIYEETPELKYIPTWEDVEGDDFAMLEKQDVDEDPLASQEAMKQLIELGYIEDPGDNVQKAVEMTVRESRYNLARVYMGTSRYVEAIPILEKLYKDYNTESRFALRLVTCYTEIGEQTKALDLTNSHNKIIINYIKELSEEFNEIKDNNFNDLEEKKKQEKLQGKNKLLRKLKDAQKDIFRIALLQTDILLKLKKPKDALKILKDIEKNLPIQRSILNKIGNVYIRLHDYKKAEDAFKKLLEIDPINHIGHNGLAIIYLRTEKYEEAVSEALLAIELVYHYPLAHHHLGEALMCLELYEEAANAFEVAIKMAPSLGKARNFLIDIYENNLNKPDLAKQHKDYFKTALDTTKETKTGKPKKVEKQVISDKIIKDPIIIVSGLPRSGTSMMMQMLEAGGIEVFTDNQRAADENNPKGYYEHEAVKRLANDKKWLPNAKNKVVKIISHLLVHLPEKYNYKIVFMERDINEIIQSQHKMLVQLGKAKADTYPAGLDMTFKENVEKIKIWAKKHHNVDILTINHKDVINDAATEARKVIDFLNIDADATKMSSVIDNKLHRTKL
jgi:tetratricopeptide (TPR) repeat protein